MTAPDNSPNLLAQALPPAAPAGGQAPGQMSGQQDPLAQLQDIHLPAEIGLWPPAIGWWLLAALIIALVAAVVFFIRRRKQRNHYRLQALFELQQLNRIAQDQNGDWLQDLSILLRRTAIAGCGPQFDTGLKGEAWLQWLDDRCPDCQQQFSQGVGLTLLTGPYEKNPECDRDALRQLARTWILQHRNQWQKPNTKTKTTTTPITGGQHV